MTFYRVTLPRLTPAEKHWVSGEIASHIREQAQLHGRNELDIHNALVQLNVFLAELMTDDAPDAFLRSERDAELLATLYVGLRTSDRRYKHAIIHELAHKLQLDWVAPELYDADHVICTDQNNTLARHAIAQDVERDFWD